MSDAEMQFYRKKLEQLAQRVRSDAEAVADETLTASGGQAAGELSNAPLHPGDRGTEEYLAEVNTTLLENEQYIVNEARAAIERIEAGTFGICEDCGRPIAKERLDAIPYTRWCAKCAAFHPTPQPSPEELPRRPR